MVSKADRCTAVDDGVRCQLFIHDDGQHAAMIRFDLAPERGKRRAAAAEYRRWGEPWTKPAPGKAPLAWAPTFPRVE